MLLCPICSTSLSNGVQRKAGWTGVECRRCGFWSIDADAHDLAEHFDRVFEPITSDDSRHKRARLSHILQCQQRTTAKWAHLPSEFWKSWRLSDPLPGAAEQLDRLVLWVGERQPSPAETATVDPGAVCAWIGSAIVLDHPNAGIAWLMQREEVKRLIEDRATTNGRALSLRLTMPGWERFNELRKGKTETRNVLMAMQFNDPELDRVFNDAFKPAVARTGFNLRRITDGQGAGLIDDQLRVALRTSRFVIADLTHGNQGAYWEAGFAEGLGRPVFYTCRDAEWRQPGVHFDTHHLVTIIWDPTDLKSACERLVATIRATLPEEARMADDET